MNSTIDPIMSEPAWIIKWRAREALKNGRVEEAHRLLDELLASGNRRAFALRDDVVRGYLERAKRMVRQREIEAAWADLRRLSRLAPTDRDVRELKESLVDLGIDEIRDALEAGQALQALTVVARLKERSATNPEISAFEEAAQDWVLAGDMADRGDFAPARAALERVRPRLKKRTAGLDRFEQELARRNDRFRYAWNDLQEAMGAKNWREMLRAADEVLAVAPRHREAQQVRSRAWQSVQAETVAYRPAEHRQGDSEAAGTSVSLGADANVETDLPLPKRFILWIDGVGAWLVCLGSRMSIGQAAPEGGPIDVPLLAEVSRIHAALTRDEESYLLETNRDVLVNGQPVSKTVLRSGDKLAISSCVMKFAQPVPGCLSARLTFEGSRRLPLAVDGVLLMADMLVLGPGEKVHVSMPELAQPLYIFRQKDRLGIRWQGEFHVEGQRFQDRGTLPLQGCVSSEAFTFAIEPLSR